MRLQQVLHSDAGRAPRPAGRDGRLVFWLFQVAFWSLYGLLYFLAMRPYHPFADLLGRKSAAAALLGLGASMALQQLYAWMRRRAAGPLVTVAGAVTGSVLLGLAWYAAAGWVGARLDPFRFPEVVATRLPGSVFVPSGATFPVILLFWSMLFWSVLYLAAAHWRHLQGEKERALKADALAHEARLRMLRYQLNPHFLFNALNSIGALADEAPHRIGPMVGELSGFLRYSLLDPDTFEVPLGEEVRAVAHYLAVEAVRFEDDLEVTLDVTPGAAERVVPAFLVLPLVENAVKYGQHTSPRPLRIRVAGRVEGGALCIEVANTGRWAAPAGPGAARGTGTGLDNVRQRLAEHYPGRHRFETFESETAETGAWVHARIYVEGAHIKGSRIEDGSR